MSHITELSILKVSQKEKKKEKFYPLGGMLKYEEMVLAAFAFFGSASANFLFGILDFYYLLLLSYYLLTSELSKLSSQTKPVMIFS